MGEGMHSYSPRRDPQEVDFDPLRYVNPTFWLQKVLHLPGEVEFSSLVHNREGFLAEEKSVVYEGKTDCRFFFMSGYGTPSDSLIPVADAFHEQFGRHLELHPLWDYDGTKENLLEATLPAMRERFDKLVEDLPLPPSGEKSDEVTVGVFYSTAGCLAAIHQALHNTFDMMIFIGVPIHLKSSVDEFILNQASGYNEVLKKLAQGDEEMSSFRKGTKEYALYIQNLLESSSLKFSGEDPHPNWDVEALNNIPCFKALPLASLISFNNVRLASLSHFQAGNVSTLLRAYQSLKDPHCAPGSAGTLLSLNRFDNDQFAEQVHHVYQENDRLDLQEVLRKSYFPGCGGGVVLNSPHGPWYGEDGEGFIYSLIEDVDINLPVLAPHVDLRDTATEETAVPVHLLSENDGSLWSNWSLRGLVSKALSTFKT